MASLYSTELYVTGDPRALAEEQPLPEALRRPPLLMRVLCFLALGRPDLNDLWRSLQSEQAFETVRSKLCSILASTITTASVILALSGVFVTTGTPVSYFDYTSPAPHCLLFISLMLAMIALLTSGSSMICWLHTDRHWTQEVLQLKPGGYFVLSYLLSIVTPMFFVAWSLHCFIFEESEKVSELKSISDSSRLLYSTLALGTEVQLLSLYTLSVFITSFNKRKSEIENERLPPELFDAEEAKAFLAQAQPRSTPADTIESPVTPSGSPERWTDGFSAHPIQHPFQGQRWSAGFAWDDDDESLDEAPEFLENTISMIREALDGKDLQTRGLPGNGSPYGGGSGSSSYN
ncbi:hypothetical protein DFJ58DRAFT_750240 [Suillus subalutaceus]|uniref:uncharacterized protein n=1 Tax=Suillus subalutaceus TaxID=48586 RepID=UPI001B87D5C5|nr:uncharacterized protein DFJ58DRAFT_750240 [Suillus subalutaceus]KAG1833995.1 hypothetical protein DFJ58DRAFT_750240 [Suillus subalutaceus]